jgi:tetratricopeptide (TPR) repeat protein
MSTVDWDVAVLEDREVAHPTSESLAPRNPTLPVEVSQWFADGLDLINQGEPAAAVTKLEETVRRLPEFADAHIGLGIAYAVTGKIYPALDHLEEAVNLEPDNFFAHFKLGQLQFKLHVPKKGYEEMQKALDCATSIEERKLVGQLIHDQKKREQKGLARPTWDRPFSSKTLLLVAVSVILPILYMFLATLR